MYRKDDKKQNITHINYLFDDVGLGDAIAALPALKYIYTYHPHVVAHIWTPDYFYDIAVRSLPKDKNRIIIRKLSEAKNKYNDKFPGRSFKLFNYIALATHPTNTAFFNFIHKQVDNSEMNYLQMDTSDQNVKQFNLPEKYVVVTVCHTVDVREFLPEHINKVVDFIKSKGYEVVFLGKQEASNGLNYTIKGNISTEIDFNKGVDLLNKTTILETREIIKNAKCIVGLDNGILHLAGTTDIPIVGGFTSVEPIARMPYRYGELGWGYHPVVPPVSLECRFCQSNMTMTLGHDFRTCFYGDRLCVYQLTADLYIDKLKEILK